MSDADPTPAGPDENAAARPEAPARRSYRGVAIWLGGALLVIVWLVVTAPFWISLLPWGPASARNDAALDARLDRLEAAQAKAQQLMQQSAAETAAAAQRIGQRLDALEARPATAATDIAEIRRQLADLATRVAAIDNQVSAQAARDPADLALALVLLQIKNAVAAGRPFAAEYEALTALARGHPEIATAAAGLAEPAKAGVASGAVLTRRLHELAGAIAGAGAPANASGGASGNDAGKARGTASGWVGAALARLRSLVTIRRIDDAGHRPSDTAVNQAELALAGGDVTGAVAALGALTGAAAEVAGPWLRMARERLAVDAALQRVETLLAARLGTPSAGSGSPR